nr:hypothetical protein [Moritella viscosa]SHO15715.1 HipA domain protein [Moritella viscosa]
MNIDINKEFHHLIIDELETLATDNGVTLWELYIADVNGKALGGEMHFDIFQYDLEVDINDTITNVCVYTANTEEIYARRELKELFINNDIDHLDF